MNNSSLYTKIAICVVICIVAGFTSGSLTADGIQNWYSTLNKPFFNPPNWIFAPVWTILYILIGIAVAMIWHKGFKQSGVKIAIGLFIAQFAVNLLWSPIFFNLQAPTIALIIIIILWFLILMTIMHFNKLDKIAGRLLIPYFLWVSFASILNGAIVYLN